MLEMLEAKRAAGYIGACVNASSGDQFFASDLTEGATFRHADIDVPPENVPILK
ncbi:hypothetical protein [Komagataeibacter melomenusus]|uniref:hypothetical protein n=1 Tax=Komagataeibacter melomenusus TaxID=2766578 RepID=UPI001C2D433E|nr:hypothetical protein [Komagataeibacter melomenusus]